MRLTFVARSVRAAARILMQDICGRMAPTANCGRNPTECPIDVLTLDLLDDTALAGGAAFCTAAMSGPLGLIQIVVSCAARVGSPCVRFETHSSCYEKYWIDVSAERRKVGTSDLQEQ